MTDVAYRPVKHQHAAFLKKASKRTGFKAAYEALANEYAVANELLKARTRAGPHTRGRSLAHGHQQKHHFPTGSRGPAFAVAQLITEICRGRGMQGAGQAGAGAASLCVRGQYLRIDGPAFNHPFGTLASAPLKGYPLTVDPALVGSAPIANYLARPATVCIQRMATSRTSCPVLPIDSML